MPSLGTLLRIGLAAAFLLSVQSASERLAWRSNGLPFGATYDHSTGRVAVNDFASIFGLAKAVIGGAIERPYSEAGQLQFMEGWTGRRVDEALVYAYSPTLWLILLPLLALPVALAYVVWTFLPTVVLLGAGWRLTATERVERSSFPVLVVLIALMSGAYQGVVQLGQTPVVLGLIAFALISTARDPERDLLAASLLFLLTAKPPLALAMGVGMLWNRQATSVRLACALAGLEVALVTAWLGFGWISDYWTILTHFTSDAAPPWYRAFVGPIGMTNAREALVAGAGWSDRAAASASAAAWVAGMGCGTWLAYRSYLPSGPLRLAFALLLYCLFSPHLTFSNDVLMVIVVWFLDAEVSLGTAPRVTTAMALVLVVNSGPFKTFFLNDAGAAVAFLAKSMILALFLAGSWRVAPLRRAG